LCVDFVKKSLTGTTTVYFASGGSRDPVFGGSGWQSVSKAMRRLDIIDMDEVTKADVVRDAEYYYIQESRSYFADCGISYHHSYLFYGPSGTGKSSFSAALAGYLGCDIYHINLASGNINDSALHRLFLGLPRKCVVVIEDIDSAGIGREQVPQEDQARFMDPLELDLDFNPGFDQMNRKWNKSSSVAITLSGLLNAIDGNAFQEGVGMFKRLIGRAMCVQNPGITTEQIDEWAIEFASKVPANTFSPAEIHNFLQGCRGDAAKALREIGAWVAENRTTASTTAGSEADTEDVESLDASHPFTPGGHEA
ncbi:ATPase (AAA+ superfamily), partial [Pyrenophora tritici-repentis]